MISLNYLYISPARVPYGRGCGEDLARAGFRLSESGCLNCGNRRAKLGAMHKESCDMTGEMMSNY